jgi:hypothetical protein
MSKTELRFTGNPANIQADLCTVVEDLIVLKPLRQLIWLEASASANSV